MLPGFAERRKAMELSDFSFTLSHLKPSHEPSISYSAGEEV